jgi:hypothetical protein
MVLLAWDTGLHEKDPCCRLLEGEDGNVQLCIMTDSSSR